MRTMLERARAGKYAVGHFNINGLLWAQAILQAAEAMRAPVILAASDRLIHFLGGFKTIFGMVHGLIDEMGITVPVALHFDHGATVERCREAIDAGFTSVMIDGSPYPLEDNIRMTREVMAYARPRQVSVEAEVGIVGGSEDGMAQTLRYANPQDCVRLVEATHIDALAAALGSVHGRYHGAPQLGFEMMQEIWEATQTPLVLHGGSGIPAEQIRRAIALGHAKINVNTESIQTWAHTLREILSRDPDVYEPRLILTPCRERVTVGVMEKIQEFGSHHRV